MVKSYELTVLFSPENTSDAQQKLQDKIAHIITSAGGKISKTDVLGRKLIAYPIQKHTEALFVMYFFTLDSTKAQETERAVLLTEGVMRHLFVASEE